MVVTVRLEETWINNAQVTVVVSCGDDYIDAVDIDLAEGPDRAAMETLATVIATNAGPEVTAVWIIGDDGIIEQWPVWPIVHFNADYHK